jgi:hypothetical protein
MAAVSRSSMISLPKYRFDPSNSVTTRVGDFSTIRFDRNNYSVPVEYAGKEVSVKGYGNEVVILSKNQEIARYPRCYQKGKTQYRLEHYLDLIEKRPRSVFNAKPVKENVSSRLLEVGRRLGNPGEMVKLLRLCVDYGEDKVLEATKNLGTQELSVSQILGHLIPVDIPAPVDLKMHVSVSKPQLEKYNLLVTKGIVQ